MKYFQDVVSLDISNWQVSCVKEMKNLKMTKRMRGKVKLKKKSLKNRQKMKVIKKNNKNLKKRNRQKNSEKKKVRKK